MCDTVSAIFPRHDTNLRPTLAPMNVLAEALEGAPSSAAAQDSGPSVGSLIFHRTTLAFATSRRLTRRTEEMIWQSDSL